MSDKSPIKLLLVDDHDVVRDGLVAVLGLEPDIHVVGSVGSGREALAACANAPADVVMLDLRMPGMDGLETLRELRLRFPALHVLMLSSHDGDEAIFRALQAGAVGYLLKSATRVELVAAIHGAMHGRVPPDGLVASRLATRRRYEPLTTREIDVLGHIAIGESNKEIASALDISVATVKNHINKILFKLDVSDRTEAVTISLQRGIIDLGQ